MPLACFAAIGNVSTHHPTCQRHVPTLWRYRFGRFNKPKQTKGTVLLVCICQRHTKRTVPLVCVVAKSFEKFSTEPVMVEGKKATPGAAWGLRSALVFWLWKPPHYSGGRLFQHRELYYLTTCSLVNFTVPLL